MAEPIKLFFSYSHRDEAYRDELEKHLSVLRRQGVITAWHDRRIVPGVEWAREISRHLTEANIILLLVSNEFLASEYCWEIEMKTALDRHERGEAVVIPVIVRPVDFEGAPFAALQALPKDARPISTWQNYDEAWVDVSKGIRKVCRDLQQRIEGAAHVISTASPPETKPDLSGAFDWNKGAGAFSNADPETGEQANATAAYMLGQRYQLGEGVEQDHREAVRWYRVAAEQGDVVAQFNLGVKYERGQGVEQDFDEALRWYRAAAEEGYAAAQNNIGAMYELGNGVEMDFREAARWYRDAAEQGYALSQLNLGLVLDALGDFGDALRWYRKAAAQGRSDAQHNIGLKYQQGRGVEQDDRKALQWYRKAAEQGLDAAQYKVGSMYEDGRGVEQDFDEALRWYRAAAEQDHASAQYRLGLMYERGRGIEKDYRAALAWYRKALANGVAKAAENIQSLS